MKKNAIIQLRNIKKAYHNADVETLVLKDITLTVYEGDFIAITGPSGSGKSTLMNIIGLLDNPTSGTYMLGEDNVANLSSDQASFFRNKKIGFVFQSFNLLQRTTALENVMLPAVYAGVGIKQRTERATKLLEMLGLGSKLQSTPSQLSGGQQQRVAIARALMNNPNFILADEPTGNLDSKSGNDVMQIFKQLHKENKTIILITHELDIAKQTNKTIHLKDGIII